MYESLIAALRNVSEYDSGYAKLMYDAADAIEAQDRHILTLQHEMMAEAESHIAEVNRLNKQIEVLSKMEKTTRWIPETERLPEIPGEYMVAYHPCYWDKVYDEIKVGLDSFRGKTSWAKKKYKRVTHWMPLPEPPKEE